MDNFFCSDLISEIIKHNRLEVSEFIDDFCPTKSKFFTCDSFVIKNKIQAEQLGQPIGKYNIISTQDIRDINATNCKRLVKFIASKIKEFFTTLAQNDLILVVGLGNEEIESDSLGALVTNKVIVTNIIDHKLSNLPKICTITPSVMGVTGIETADIISAVVGKIKPQYVIVIDSLCASAYERLGKSIQITNVGIIPGGGIHRPKKPLNKKTLGCEVITIGIPLMIYASTICETNIDPDKNLVVTFHDIKNIVGKLSDIIARAINYSILGIETL